GGRRDRHAWCLYAGRGSTTLHPLNPDALDLVERDRIAGTVVELGRARAFVRRHALRMFERATGIQIGRDPGRPEGMAGDAPLETQGSRAPLDHAPGVNTVHGVRGEGATLPYGRAEKGGL